MADRKNPLPVRELAAEAVGTLAVKSQNPKSGELLAQVLREDVQGQFRATGKGGERVMVYPVRRAAREAIKRMEKAGALLPSYVTAAAERAIVEVKTPAPPSGRYARATLGRFAGVSWRNGPTSRMASTARHAKAYIQALRS